MNNICALCNEREADKTNTHFLTDSLIRSALDQDGENRRDHGLFYQLQDNSIMIKTKFQRSTSPEKIEERLGRPPTDEEIEEAKQNDFSVDYAFCSECENRFEEIENEFFREVRPIVRRDAENARSISVFSDSRVIRLFFYLQIWRSWICTDNIELRNDTAEHLRQMIWKTDNLSKDNFRSYPLTLTYLITKDTKKDRTSNLITFASKESPIVIFMDKWIVQFYETRDDIRFFDFYSLNNFNDYQIYLNTDEDQFKIKIFSNDERKKLIKVIIETKTKPILDYIKYQFWCLWYAFFRRSPTDQEFYKYYLYLTKDPDRNWLSNEVIHQTLKDYFLNFL